MLKLQTERLPFQKTMRGCRKFDPHYRDLPEEVLATQTPPCLYNEVRSSDPHAVHYPPRSPFPRCTVLSLL